MNKLTYDDVINRIGFFRNKANLSARETSLRLGYSEQFVKRIENKSVELKELTLAHVDEFEKELAAAGIQSEVQSPKLLPDYRRKAN